MVLGSPSGCVGPAAGGCSGCACRAPSAPRRSNSTGGFSSVALAKASMAASTVGAAAMFCTAACCCGGWARMIGMALMADCAPAIAASASVRLPAPVARRRTSPATPIAAPCPTPSRPSSMTSSGSMWPYASNCPAASEPASPAISPAVTPAARVALAPSVLRAASRASTAASCSVACALVILPALAASVIAAASRAMARSPAPATPSVMRLSRASVPAVPMPLRRDCSRSCG